MRPKSYNVWSEDGPKKSVSCQYSVMTHYEVCRKYLELLHPYFGADIVQLVIQLHV